jgi:multiple sugar transport system permease protein
MASIAQKRLPKDRYRLHLKLFLVPFLAGSLLLVVLPALATMAVAFTEYNSIGVPSWVGLSNFGRLVRSDYVRISLYNTAIFVGLAVPIRVAAALGLALLLDRGGRLYGWFRAAVYLPTVIPEVAYALVWLWIFNPLYGPLNLALGSLGFTPPPWLAEPTTARLAIVILLSFQIGEGFVVLLAGLQTIPRAFYESARVDGASGWQTFTRITLPLLAPWLFLLTFRDLILSLQNTFTPSFVLTYGGPYYATTFAPLLIYEIAFDFFDFGLAAALLLLIYLVMAIIVLSVLNLVQSRTDFDA